MAAVVGALKASGAKTIADLGCGEGKLLQRLVRERWVTSLVGVDASARDLERAHRRLKLDIASGPKAERVRLLHGSLTYRDQRWEGCDAAALVEVIEHLELDRLPTLQKVVFGAARPATVVVSTPNAEYNALFENMPPGGRRHPDHRFEWTRAEFVAWCQGVADAHGYAFELSGIGPEDERFGPPTQMAVFTREAAL
jgi:3' terminal RNA ribose 2'-O-methyltransferase Hen1